MCLKAGIPQMNKTACVHKEPDGEHRGGVLSPELREGPGRSHFLSGLQMLRYVISKPTMVSKWQFGRWEENYSREVL